MKDLINVSNEYDVFISVYTSYMNHISRYITGSGTKSASEEAREEAEKAFEFVIKNRESLGARND